MIRGGTKTKEEIEFMIYGLSKQTDRHNKTEN